MNLPQPVQKLKVSQGVSQGLLIKSVQPEYPPQAMQMRTEGAVQLLASIGKDGSITAVKLIKATPFSRAPPSKRSSNGNTSPTTSTINRWKFKPRSP